MAALGRSNPISSYNDQLVKDEDESHHRTVLEGSSDSSNDEASMSLGAIDVSIA